MTVRAEQLGQDIWYRTAVQGARDSTAGTRQRGQNSMDKNRIAWRTAKTGQLGQDIRNRSA
jgi:hypothetical protein